jgi:type IV pilus assembly protein PilB
MLSARLKSFMISEQLLSEQQIAESLEIQKKSGARIVDIFLDKGFVEDDRLTEFFAKHYQLPIMDLTNISFNQETVGLIPAAIAAKHKVIPVGKRGETLVVAVYDPTNIQAIDDIRFETRLKVKLVLAAPSGINAIVQKFYGMEMTKLAASFAADVSDVETVDMDRTNESSEASENDAPIIKFVTTVLVDAIQKGSSDIHIEPYEKELRVRFRLDGNLYEASRPPTNVKSALVARIKVMAKLRLDEKRLPQDGRMRLKLGENRFVDLRVNILPTIYGEKVVLRILDKTQAVYTLDQLGFEEDDRAKFEHAIRQSWGMALVTGATGSGKTTTLYAALNILNTQDVNISTIEDPVEYNFTGINQCQTKEQIGFGFAEALRAFLRQDPDIILVGEIRDTETAEVGMRAALTGHMVLSTLHTNDAASAVMRLKDMNIEPFLINSAVRVVVAQRLVRKICPHCKIDDPRADEATLKRLGFPENSLGKFKAKKGKGCSECRNIGYKGRMAIYEVMPFTDPLREIVGKGGNTDDIRKTALKEGMRTLKMNCMRKVVRGETSLEDLELLGD